MKVVKQKSKSACLDVTPVRAGVALQALVAAVHVLLADPALGVLLTVRCGASLVLRVRGHLVIRQGLNLAVSLQLRVVGMKSLGRIAVQSGRSGHFLLLWLSSTG